MSKKLSKHLVTNPDEILKWLLDDPAFTEAVNRDIRGVYILGGDGSKRYITQLELEDGPLPEEPETHKDEGEKEL